MKIISKYFLKKFILYFIASFLTISFFIFLINFFENINNASKKGYDLFFALKNSFNETPYFVLLVIPIITFFASILSFNYFVTTNEYKAIYAGGYSGSIFLRPLFIASFLIFVFSITIFDSFAIKMHKKTQEAKKNVFLIQDYYVHFGDIYLGAKKIENKNLFDVYIENNEKIIISKKLCYQDNLWIALNAKIIDKNSLSVSFYNDYNIVFLPSFEKIIVEKFISDDYYDMFFLIKRIKKLLELKMDRQRELSLFYFKISLMFLNVIFVFISYLISQTEIIKQRASAISFTMVISFIMWFVIVMIKRTSDIGIINPSMIFFIPYLIFVGVIIYFFRQMGIKDG